MADIQQVTGQVNSACSRYKEDQAKMQKASSEMVTFRNQAQRAENQLNRVDEEISDIEDEIRRLEAQASRSAGEEGADVSSIYGRISDLRYQKQDLMRESSRLENEMSQARANFQQAQSEYSRAQNDATKVRSFLVNVKSQMIQAGEVFKTKIQGFDDSIQILGSASGNMFASSATSQIGKLQSSRESNQTNLNIAKGVVDQINSTLGLQGSISNVTGGGSARGLYGGGSAGSNHFSSSRGSTSGGFSSGSGRVSASGSGFVPGSSGGSGGTSGYSGSGSSSGGSSNSDFFAGIINESPAPSTSAPALSSASSGSSASSLVPNGLVPRNLSKTAYSFSKTANGQMTYDSPLEAGQYLVANQGSAYKRFQGTCGLCSIANILRLAGVNIGEKEIIDFASQGGLFSKHCKVTLFSPGRNGGTTAEQRQKILEHFGISSSLKAVKTDPDGNATVETLNDIGKWVSEGRGVIISVDAGDFYGNPKYNGQGHAVTVTSITLNNLGEVSGFYIADSNGGTKLYPAWIIQDALRANSINVTNQIIR